MENTNKEPIQAKYVVTCLFVFVSQRGDNAALFAKHTPLVLVSINDVTVSIRHLFSAIQTVVSHKQLQIILY